MTTKKSKTSKKKNFSFLHKLLSILLGIPRNMWNFLRSRRFLRFLGILFVGIGVAYLVLLYFAKDIETILTFPGKDINLKNITNHPAGIIAAEEVNLSSSSGENINGLYIDNGAEKTVYYFHGNGAPMSHFFTEMRYIADLGYNLIAFDYPGYGKSTGTPSFEENSDFAEVFFTDMQKRLGFQESDMIIWGYSVGTAIAIEFAKDKDFDSLILFSPLASRYDMGQKLLGFPLQKLFFLPNSYVSVETILSIDEPTFIVHGNRDKVIPFEQGKRVYEASPAPKKFFLELDDMGHSLITERYREVLEVYLEDFFGDTKVENTQKTELLTRELASHILKEYEQESYLKNLDVESDDSYQKYVDPEVPFSKVGYIPQDMESLSRKYIIDTKGNAQMRATAAKQFEAMAEQFYQDMGEKIVVVSSYRSYTYQAGIKSRGCPDNLCAKAGHSEHQSGLTADLWSASSDAYWKSSPRLMSYYKWLAENAHNYGFHNSYQNGRSIDGYEIEPWHWRYLGKRLASYLHKQDMTFAEFYKNKKK